MRGNRIWLLAVTLLAAVLYSGTSSAQAIVSEDFTGATTNSSWYFFNGACLTAGTTSFTGGADLGVLVGTDANNNPLYSFPGCVADGTYYNGTGDSVLVGGYYGTATGSVAFGGTTPLDAAGQGALRFTNGCINGSSNSCGGGSGGGHSQNGLIISSSAYSTDQGLDITFKTVTYRGDSGGNSGSCPSGTTAYNGNCVTTGSPTTTYTCPSGYTQSGSGSGTTCSEVLTTAPTGRHNNSCSGSYVYNNSTGLCQKTVTTSPSQTNSCSSGFTLSGSTCYNNTVTEADPDQSDGADGMSFFLMDGNTANAPITFTNGSATVGNYGSWGGSLGYTCSNSNPPYNGLVGGYIGLGIDEYGNFLNGTQNTFHVANPQSMGDNTASGGGQYANRIGLRAAGNVSWYWLNANYPTYYPSSLATTKDSNGNYYSNDAVQNTCKTGTLWNYSNASSPTNTGATAASGGAQLYDYTAISSGWALLPQGTQIANEYAAGGYSRQPYSTVSGTYGTGANPITYDLKITADGLLSLSYSFNGGGWRSVIKNASISATNIALPSTVRFGFAGSTGGSSNIHEVLCFKAAPASQAASSTTVNQQQSSKVETGSQAYFGYYDPQNWTGTLTANSLVNTNGVLTISATANWDASCVLTGVTTGKCGTTGVAAPISAQPWQASSTGGRVILTWSGAGGIPFEWASLTATEQGDLDAGDSGSTGDRLQLLRGDPQEQIQHGGTFRNLDSVLGDIIDSSSAWVGPPSKSIFSSYEVPGTWLDKLNPGTTMGENSGQSYANYVGAEAQRQNLVYVGANDGMVHGFAAGSFDSTGTNYNSSTNTGQELLAYMPQGVLETIHNASNSYIDYANPQYGHNYYVDATPGTGDLFYAGNCGTGPSPCWHTWLVGGLGSGGSEIYALDITNPANFTEGNASSLVIGDWQGGTSTTSPGSFTCANNGSCALSLGNTYGTPTIRRFHNGDWGVIFGNGLNSSSGDAGIFVLTINPNTDAESMYYLSTGESGSGDGIAYAHPVDMDGDHVVDYVYAGDKLGNVWRFDLTSSNPTGWAVTGGGPLFSTGGQPITSDVFPAFVQGPGGATMLMLFFGTGQKFPITQTQGFTYAPNQQSFYGIWDWNMTGWNANDSTQFASLASGTAGTLSPSNLQAQTVSIDSTTHLTSIETPFLVCWQGSTTCSAATVSAGQSSQSSDNQYGWYINFPGSNSGYGTTTYEQDIYNPILVTTAIQFNSVLPAIDSPLMCTPDQDSGWSYALNVLNGTPVSGFFVNNGNTKTIALQTNASGSSSEVTATSTNGSTTNTYLIYQKTSGGAGGPTQIQPANNVTGYRETWLQLR